MNDKEKGIWGLNRGEKENIGIGIGKKDQQQQKKYVLIKDEKGGRKLQTTYQTNNSEGMTEYFYIRLT